jgi:hypothetical protein
VFISHIIRRPLQSPDAINKSFLLIATLITGPLLSDSFRSIFTLSISHIIISESLEQETRFLPELDIAS